MAERERLRERQGQTSKSGGSSSSHGHQSPPSSSSSAGGGGGLFMNLFGGSRRTTPSRLPPESSSSSTKALKKQTSKDDLRSPTSVSPHLSLPPASHPPGGNTINVVPSFDLASALESMQPGAEESSSKIVDIVNTTAAWLINLLLTTDDIFASQSDESKPQITIADIRALYIRSTSFAQSDKETNLRTAAIRLLAALIATFPPSKFSDSDVNLPSTITARSIYDLVCASTNRDPQCSHVDAVFVETGALKALTKNGEDLQGTDKILTWLLKSLDEIKDEWVAWCMQEDRFPVQEWSPEPTKARPFGPIKPATPGEAATAIVDLVACIVTAHTSKLSSVNLETIVKPVIEFAVAGIAAATVAHSDHPDATVSRTSSMRDSASAPSIAATAGLNLETSLRRSGTLTRARGDKSQPHGSPSSRPSARSSVATGLTSPPQTADLRSPPAIPRDRDEAKWTRVIPPLSSLCETVANQNIASSLFTKIMTFLCLCFGQDEDQLVTEATWGDLGDVMVTMLGRKTNKRAEKALRDLLEGKVSLSDFDASDAARKVTRGAVIASKYLLRRLSSIEAATLSLAELAPSLQAATSSAQSTRNTYEWLPVDLEVLALIQDNLFALENQADLQVASNDAWTESEATCNLLKALVRDPSVASNPNYQHFTAVYNEVVHLLPSAIGRLHPSSSTTPSFYHPKYIDLLLDMAPTLDEDHAAVVISYYQRESLCLPFTKQWLQNIQKLVDGFLNSDHLPQAKHSVQELLLRDVYSYADELPEYREALLKEVLLPYLQKGFDGDHEPDFYKLALPVLVEAAIGETIDKDRDMRRANAAKSDEELDKEEDSPEPSADLREMASSGNFDTIRSLLVKMAAQTPCNSTPVSRKPAPQLGPQSPSLQAQTPSSMSSSDTATEKRNVSKGKETATSTLRGLMDVLSPPSRTRDITPAGSGVTSPVAETDIPSLDAAMFSAKPPVSGPTTTSNTVRPSPQGSMDSASHSDCQSIGAVDSLISIFLRLAFGHSAALQTARSTRCPSTMRCITIFRDLLNLLYPMTDDSGAARDAQTPVKIAARCPKARIAILQLLMRLRADSDHKTYVLYDLDRGATFFAAILKRTVETEAEKRAELEEVQRKASVRAAARAEASDDRGRTARPTESSTRSRSRSTQPVLVRGADPSYSPLWRIPDQPEFKIPQDLIVNNGIATYDPRNPCLKDPNSPRVQGIWLPVSDYIRCLNGILRGHDWELVSYVLTFLPLQLSNKIFFHGARATKEIKALLDVLCSGVLGVNAWERRFNVPSFIKRVDINAAAYHSLSILLSYRGLFTRAECDRLVQAFIVGLQGKGDVAKPCLQALTLAVFEMEQSVSRHLLDIVRAMTSILTTTGLAVHILEFLISLGQNGALFRNFTDEQYRLVFRVAITYITEHNARSDSALDLKDDTIREGYILSQHVIGLAYYAIYIWFMALRLPQRPALVTEITRELLKGRSQRVTVDEMAEVCFDWLGRYTYGNADPKPATSFLSEMVMDDQGHEDEVQTKSWMLGGSIVSVTTHARTGWATMMSIRPTGATSVVCKLENVPHLDVGEANADLRALPAVLMANRQPQKGDDPSPKDIVQVPNGAPPAESFDQSSQHGYIWSGATPSQRRKDLVIDPSYLGLQLLSSYPNASLDVPRGRLIPDEEKFQRALRMIQNTPVIDTLKIAVFYVGRNQTKETDVLANLGGPRPYLDLISGLGRLIRLKGQVDVFVGGLNRDNDSDGEYAYAWWDDLSQMIFHIPTMMPNLPQYPNYENKKRLVGNDYVKIVYNNSGKEFQFDTIKTDWNFVNIVITPHSTGPFEDDLPNESLKTGWRDATLGPWAGQGQEKMGDVWLDWDREDWFKVTIQRAPGIPEFSPIGTHKLVSGKSLPILVRHIAHLANDMAARFVHIRSAEDVASAEYITSWRSRLRAMTRLRQMLPAIEVPPEEDHEAREQLVRDFTRIFSYRPPAPAQKET